MSFTVYRSSAGSGKTFTLVREYLRLSLATEQPDLYRHILAITFTNKAANEMKERVVKALKELSSDEPPTGSTLFLQESLCEELNIDDHHLRLRASFVLEHLLHHYSDFSISTIDKFVHRVIRAFAHDLRIPMNFEVELDARTLLSRAIDLLLADIGTQEKLTKALVEFSESKADEEKSWQIERDLFRFAANLLDETGHFHLKKIKDITLDEFFEIRDELNERIATFNEKISTIGKEALGLLDHVGLGPEAMAGGKNGIIRYFAYLAEVRENYLLPKPSILKIREAEKWHSAKASDTDRLNIDSISDRLAEYFDNAQVILEKEHANHALYLLIRKNIYALAVLNELEKIITAIKEENNLLHISEFNKKIAEIVLHEPAPFIYERLGERYHHYLIDEFQDTSVLQFQNLLPLIDNSLAQGNFNMVVGDGKQSIYRWRGGEVEQFARLPEISFPEKNFWIEDRQDSLQRNFEEQVLGNNFRSKAEIVSFNNFFFTELSKSLEAEYQNIYAQVEQAFDPENKGGSVSIEVIQPGEDTDLDEATANRVLELLPQLLMEGYRKKDITLLCRRNREASLLATALLEHGIDVISSESLLLNQSPKVQLVMALMQFLSDPEHDIHASMVLIRFARAGLVEKDWFEALRQLNDRDTGFNLETYLEEAGFAIKVEELQQLAPLEMLEELIRIFGFNQQANPHLTYLQEAIFRFTGQQGNNLRDLLNWWDEENHKLSIVIPEGTDAVQVMTIHKSKGLEFPVVIFPFANWADRLSSDNLWLELNREQHPLSAALVPAQKGLSDTQFSHRYTEEKNKSQLDNFNLLYVAFTRPVERLYVLTSPKDRIRTLSANFLPFLQNREEWDEETGRFTWGEATPATKGEEQEPETSISIESLISLDWHKKLTLGRQAPQLWDLENPEASKNYGKLMHTALAGIRTPEDIEPTLKKLQLSGMIRAADVPQFDKKIGSLLKHPELKALFRKGLNIKTEADILLADGRSYRPDRVIIENGNATIIDYKTGKKLDEHQDQLERYERLLLEMGYSEVRKLIVYTEPEEVVEV